MVERAASGRRQEQVAHRHARIVAAARELAESSGWDGVTTRRLADAIGYSQPVLYGHFPQGKTEIMAAVAQLGFVEMAAAMSAGVAPADQSRTGESVDPAQSGGSTDGGDPSAERLLRTVEGYLAFAAENPATYDAMFSLPTEMLFADPDTPQELRAGFDVLVRAVGGDPSSPRPADGLSAELLWSMLHGMATLERGGRVRPEDRKGRVAAALELFSDR